MTPAIRMQTVEEYYFSTKREEMAALEQQGLKIINLGIGNPDLPTHPDVIAELEQTVRESGSNYYQPYRGIPELRNAFKNWYQKIYNVNLKADKHILPLAGSKEAIMHIHMAFCDPGDEILVPNPGYPTYSSTAKLLQVNIKHYSLTEENNWQPNMEELNKLVNSKTKILWVNYPHMPTGANAHPNTFRQLIKFAMKHKLLIVNDNPYSFILNSSPKSILSYCEESDPVIELNSLSKSHNMAGWRVGVAVGNDQILEEVLKVKSNFDSGMFKPIQKAAIKALELDEEWFNMINEEYRFRKILIHDILEKLQCEFKPDTTGLFVWAKIPKGFLNGEEFSNYLLHEKGIFASPGHIFGSSGDPYIRFSLCANQKDIIESRNRIATKKMAV
jgi:LL-diaminopimelate aminotransferase